MAGLTLSRFGDVRLEWNEAELAQLLRSKQGPVYADLYRRALRVETLAKQNASQPPRGGIPGAGSEPGQGPAVRSGRLRASITGVVLEDPAFGLYASVGSNVFYAPFVEFGTQRMDARPFLRPALAAAG